MSRFNLAIAIAKKIVFIYLNSLFERVTVKYDSLIGNLMLVATHIPIILEPSSRTEPGNVERVIFDSHIEVSEAHVEHHLTASLSLHQWVYANLSLLDIHYHWWIGS